MARNLGEAFVQISPDLSGFGPELQAGVQAAMSKAVGEVEEANDEIEASFRATAQAAETALGQVDGDGFQKVRQAANQAGETIGAQLREGALEGDRALADVDGDGFREVRDEAKKAGDAIGDSLAEGAKEGDRAISNLAKSAGFAALAAGITKFATDSVNAFADLGETVSKATVIFGDGVDEIIRFGDEASQALGQSKQAAIAAASDFAIFGNAAGLTGQELANFSVDLTTLASDLASFSNTTPEDAVLALGAALRGESEPIRRYGVLLNEATLQQRAVEMGIRDTLGPLTQQERVLAAQAEIFAQTSLAQGDFARTSDSLANQQKILAAEFKDLQVTIGEALAPVFQTLVNIAGEAISAFGALPGALQATIAVAVIGGGAFGALSNAIQNLGVAAGTANKALGVIGITLTAGIAIYSLLGREAKQAEERQNLLNTALVEANDPTATLTTRVQELVTQWKEFNPEAETAAETVENFAGAQAFAQGQLLQFTDALAGVGASVEDITNSVKGGTDDFQELAKQLAVVGSSSDSTTENLDVLVKKIQESVDASNPLRDSLISLAQSGNLTNGQFRDLVNALDETADAFDDQREATNRQSEAFLTSEGGAKALSDILGEDLFNAILSTSLATADVVGRSDDYTFALENLYAAADEATVAEQARWEQMTLAQQVAEDSARAQETYNEELRLAEERLSLAEDAINQVIEAQYALIDATLGAINSDINYRNQIDRTITAIQDYKTTEDDLTTTINEKDAALRDATSQILRQAEAAVQAAVDNGTLTEAQLAAGGAQKLMADELRTLAGLLDPSDPLRANLLAYATELETKIPPTVETEIIAEVEGARQNLYTVTTEATRAGIETGANFALGMAEGMRRQTAVIQGQVQTLIEETRWAARRAAEIESPSQLFAREVGEPIAEGVAEGIRQGEYFVVTAMDGLTTYVIDEATGTIYELNTLLAEAVASAESVFSETLDLIRGRRSQEDMARRVVDAEQRVADAQEKVTEAIAESGIGSREYETAQRNLENAQRALEDANLRLLETQYDLIEQGPAGVQAFRDLASAAGLEVDEINDLVKAYQDLAQARRDEAAAREEAAARGGGADVLPGQGGPTPISGDDLLLGFPKEVWDNIDWAGLGNLVGLANGAIVSDKTYAMIGEAGPEAVIPISRPGRALELMAESGLLSLAQTSGAGGPAVQIQNATFASATDADLVAQRVNAAYRARTINV
jgi:hypothetical protein